MHARALSLLAHDARLVRTRRARVLEMLARARAEGHGGRAQQLEEVAAWLEQMLDGLEQALGAPQEPGPAADRRRARPAPARTARPS